MGISRMVDTLIGIYSPERQYKRERARHLTDAMREHLGRSYDAAGRQGRGAVWNATTNDANEENRSAMAIIRDRVRDLYRNNPWAKNGIDVLVNNVIGKGINARTDDDNVAEFWKLWAGTKKCDHNSELNFSGIQRLVARTTFIGAECLIRKRVRKPTPSNPIPLALQVLEPDFIDTNRDEVKTDSNNRVVTKVIQGIKYDQQGHILGYYLFEKHPGSRFNSSIKSHFVSYDQLIHIHDFRRPGEVRAVPRLSPIIQRLQNIDQYEDAELEKQKVAALFSAFYKNVDGDDLRSVKDTEVPSHMEPGTIEFLPDNYDVEFSNPPSKEGYSEFMRQQLLAISSALGITYESLSSDLRQTSFSSGRIGQHEMTRNIESIQDDIFIPQMCERVWEWFIEALSLTTSEGNVAAVTATWHRPARFIVDPKSETEADKEAVRCGFKTLPGIQRDRGQDPDLIMQEIIENNKLLDDNDIILDTDPRNTDSKGSARKEESESPPDDGAGNRSIDESLQKIFETIKKNNKGRELLKKGSLYRVKGTDDILTVDDEGQLHEYDTGD